MKRKLFLQNRPLIGIDISHTYIKVMSLDPFSWAVHGYGSINADPQKLRSSLTGSPDYIASLLKDLLSKNLVGKVLSDHAVISIPTSVTYSRTASLPQEAAKNLEEAIALEAGQYIPVALTELNLSYEVLSDTSDKIDVLMSAAPKKIIENVVAACESVGLTVLMVQPSISAVGRLITAVEQGTLPTVIVDIGAADTDLAILNTRIRATASTQVGGNTLTYAISEKMGVTLEAAHQLKVLHGLAHGPKQKTLLDALDRPLMQIVNEIHKIIRYYNERLDTSSRIEQIVIVGSGSDIPGIGDYFTDKLIMPARVASPWIKLNFDRLPQPPKQFRPRYITVIGLAALKPAEVSL